MSGNHPKLILDGIKTMTRRTQGLDKVNADPSKWISVMRDQMIGIPLDTFIFHNKEDRTVDGEPIREFIKCPYGQVGDRLWVRETYNLHTYAGVDDKRAVLLSYKAGGMSDWYLLKDINPKPPFKFQKWQPSIFMPLWASRITLEITEEKAARTQDLTLAEAIAEGYSSIKEANRVFLKLAHLPEGSNGWNWVIFYKLISRFG